MQLNRLAITNFKNIPEAQLEFSPKVNCFLGNNGMGKSNLLDAIYYLSFCRSFSGLPDARLLRNGEPFATVRGNYERRGIDEELLLGLREGHRQSFRRGGKEYTRLSTHIGAFPLVLASPADSDLINGTGEERRRLMDMVISQADPVYLDHLIRYTRALQQRNKMLRDHIADPNLYLAVELSMEPSALYITSKRSEWTAELSGIFAKRYAAIAADTEVPAIALQSHLAEEPAGLGVLLDRNRRRDEALGYTSVGPHRDDLDLQLNGMPVRRVASQGQCKTYTIALRLAQYEFLEESSGMKPLLLLDDIFDRLDAERVEKLIDVVASPGFGQIFITDTNRTHLDQIISLQSSSHSSWQVTSGSFTPL